MKCNGTYLLKVRTRHGTFDFKNQKFYSPEDGSQAFLQALPDEQAAITQGLKALAIRLCLDTASYEKARQTLAEITGQSLLRRQTLCNWVLKTAHRIDKQVQKEIQQGQDLPLPPLSDRIDLYDPNARELHLFEDGILVKAQKETHEKQGVPKKAKIAQFHQSYFSLAPRPEGGYTFVFGPRDGPLEISAALRAYFCREWQGSTEPLCLVAITDGAKDLRRHLREAFGEGLVIFLDWFHLRKKVCECASMMVSTKEARTQLKKQLLKLLFHGKVSEALGVISELPVRHKAMHEKLISYLTRHAEEILDYARRAQAKKTIGSGRMEKGVDQVIGQRQKDRGMSWSARGSYALGMVSAFLANGQWDQLWNASASVA